MPSSEKIAAFIERWSKAEASERANYALFLTELCDILDVPRPDPAGRDNEANAYVFERAVTFQHAGGKTSTGRIDRGCRHVFELYCDFTQNHGFQLGPCRGRTSRDLCDRNEDLRSST